MPIGSQAPAPNHRQSSLWAHFACQHSAKVTRASAQRTGVAICDQTATKTRRGLGKHFGLRQVGTIGIAYKISCLNAGAGLLWVLFFWVFVCLLGLDLVTVYFSLSSSPYSLFLTLASAAKLAFNYLVCSLSKFSFASSFPKSHFPCRPSHLIPALTFGTVHSLLVPPYWFSLPLLCL